MKHFPQYLMLALMGLGLALEYVRSGEHRRRFSPSWATADAVFYGSILYAGGFFAPLGWGP